MYILYLSIIITLAHLPLFSTENKLRTVICRGESFLLLKMYEKCLGDLPECWNKIKEYHEKNRIDFNVPLIDVRESPSTEYPNPLHWAIQVACFPLADKLLDEKTISVTHKTDSKGNTLLHDIAVLRPYFHEKIILKQTLIQKLINKGCSLNSINHFRQTPLELVYYGDSWELNSVEWKCPSSTLFIENGSQLMVKDGQRTWNILRQCCKLYKMQPEDKKLQLAWIAFTTNERIFTDLPIITDALCNKFKYDYKTYCRAFVTMMLLSKRLKSEKNIFIPKVISHYITNFLNPIEHIENTLQDAWRKKPWYAHSFATDNDFLYPNARIAYDELRRLVTPSVWAHAWKEYKQGDRKESNLIMRALAYNNSVQN